MATCVCVDALAVNVVLLLWLMLSPVVFRWRAWDCVLCCVCVFCVCVLVLVLRAGVVVLVSRAGDGVVCWY